MEEYEDFRDTVKKVNLSRVHKITNSIGTYDIYKIIRKDTPSEKKKEVSEKIVGKVLADLFLKKTFILSLGK